MQQRIQEKYFSIFKQLATLSWPVVLAFMMHVGYNIVDIFWVGKLGASAIAAVSLAGNVFFLILAVGQIIGSGTIALVAHSFGAKLIERANSIIRQSLLLAAIIALLVSTSGFIFSKQIMILLGGRGDILLMSTEYLRIVFIGFFFHLLTFSINYAFRGAGDMKTPMMIMLVATIINVVLDPLLILGIGFFPRLEVQGAAIATAIAKCISFLFGSFILIRGRSGIKLNLFGTWHSEARVIKTILSIGVPVGISYALMGLTAMAVFRIIASFSEYALAALGVGMRILQLASLPVVSIGISTTTLVGQSFGARDVKKALQIGTISMTFCTIIMIIFNILFITNAQFLISLFTDNPQVINYGIEFLQIASLYLVFIGLTTSMTGVLRGAGFTLPPMLAGLLKLLLLILLAPIFAHSSGMGVKGIWWVMVITYGIETVMIVIWYTSKRWRKSGTELLDRLHSVGQ